MSVTVVSQPLPVSGLAARAVEALGTDQWYVPRPTGEGWSERATAARAAVARNWLDSLAPALAAGGAARDRLSRVAKKGVVVTTGQQPGLFGGPLYTWFKALSALALADELEERLGIPVAPVFWAATDDSDVAEATSTVVSVAGGAETIQLNVAVPRETTLASIPVEDATAALDRLAAASGSARNARALELARGAYAPRATLGSAYLALLRAILEPLGIAVLDAAHPVTRTAGGPLMRMALRRANLIAERLTDRAHAISAVGLKPQVHHVAGRTLVFSVDGATRTRVRMSEAEALSGNAAPHGLAPNVLLRPVVERSILPTVAYVAGPAELAYFAQVSAVADALEEETPLAVPRWSGILLEPHVEKILQRLGATPEDFRDPHAMESRAARAELPPGTRALIAAARDRAAELGPHLAETTRREALPVSASAVEGAARQLLHKLDRLERRMIAAVKRKGSDQLRDVATARGALFPNGVPQERALNMIPFLARYGDDVMQRVLTAAREHARAL